MSRMPGRTCWFVMLAALCGCNGPAKERADTGASCPEGTLADGEDCVPEACGAGTWGDLPVDDATFFVDGAAGSGGDGSEAAPFGSIQAALDAAGAAGGGLVAVAAGSYAELLDVTGSHGGVTLAGRCADLVAIDASATVEYQAGVSIQTAAGSFELSGMEVHSSNDMGVFVGSGVVTLRDLRITGNGYSGLFVSAPSVGPTTSLLVEDCEIVENLGVGAHFQLPRAEAVLRRVAIRDSQFLSTGLPGVGISAMLGAKLWIESSEIVGNRMEGVLVFDDPTAVELSDTLIEGTHRGSDGYWGQAVQASSGSSLELRGCELVDNAHTALTVVEEGTSAVVEDCVIRDTRTTEDGLYGSCAEVGEGASLILRDCELSGFSSLGAGATGEGTLLRLEGTTVRDAAESELQPSGAGAYALDQASMEIAGCIISNAAVAGVMAASSGTSVQVSDTTIRRTRAVTSEGHYGVGMLVGVGATLEASVCEVTESATLGVLVCNAGSLVSLDDVRITDTQRGRSYTVAVGAGAVGGGALSARDLTVSGCEGPGLYALSPGSVLSCEDCVIKDTQFAAAVAEEGASLVLTGSAISDTLPDANLGGGVGIWASSVGDEPTSIELSGSAVSGNPVGGVWLSGPGSYALWDNELHGGEGEARGSLQRCGDAVYARDGVGAWDGEQGLLLEGNTLRDGLGAGLFLDDARATLEGNQWIDNSVDLVSQGSSCGDPPEGLDTEAVGSTELCPQWDYSTCGDQFQLYLQAAELEG